MIIKFFLFFLKSKWIFQMPVKRDLLIYDVQTKTDFIKILFKNKKFEIFYTRNEVLNFAVLFSSIFKYGLNRVNVNYKKRFFEIVQPKIIYTSIDSNVGFYKLKDIYPHAKYIADQWGISKVTGATWPNKFFWDIQAYNKKKNKKARADIIFVFGNNEKRRLVKIIDGKYYVLGNTKNNAYIPKSKIKKRREITYICSGLWQPSWNRQCKTFKMLNKFCNDNKIKLNFLPKLVTDTEKFGESYYRKLLGHHNWKYINHSKVDVYRHLLSQELVVFAHSTLGYEVMAKGIKVVVLSEYFPEKMSKKFYKRKGPFWTYKTDYITLAKLFDKMYRMKKKEWDKIYKKYSYQIMFYDKNNLNKKKVLKSVIKVT